MYFVKTCYGTAFYLNDKLIGWVTKSINGKYYYGMKQQKTSDKQLVDSYQKAKLEIMNAIGE
jgi:hypothetical protein